MTRRATAGSFEARPSIRAKTASRAAALTRGEAGLSTDPNRKDRQFVGALARGLEVLRAFREDDGPLGNQEIAQRTGFPKPTISRFTYTLTRLGYLSYSERLGKYQIGPAVLGLAHSALASMTVRQFARPHMQELADHANASISLGSRDRLSMIYIENCRSSATITLRLDVGSRIPIATTAMGRAFLAGLPEIERGFLMDHIRRRHRDDWTTIRAGIERAIRDVADRGFCMSVGDWQPDIHAVGVPLKTGGGDLLGLSCGGPAFLTRRKRLEEDLGPRLVEVARNIQAGLAGR